MHKKERAKNENTHSWKEWLKNVGISDGHARKLRQISFILVNYSHFRNVGLPLDDDDVYKHINEIENLLVTDKDAEVFWRTGKRSQSQTRPRTTSTN